jgi:putative nucleotidyltransferase with HDIG domain
LGLIALDNLTAGDILSQEVRDINGRLLLNQGKTIDAGHIRLLKIWGVPEVCIQDVKKAPVSRQAIDSAKSQRIELAVHRMFQNIDTDHPAMAAVLKAAVDHRRRHDLTLEYAPLKSLSPDFRLDLFNAVQSQIQFSELELPESPQIMLQFNKVAADPNATSHSIAEVVTMSPSLAALLLKIANSAAFGFASRIHTISRAVTLLGTREVGALVMGISIMRLFHNIPKNMIDMPTFLRHCLACGLLTRILAARANMPHTEQMFVAGLLHDIGRLVWYRYFPEQAKLSLEIAKSFGISLYDIENERLGISHEQIAGQLFQKWKLPDALTDCVLYHHRPSRCPDPSGAAIVHMADIAVNALGLGHSGEHILARFESKVWNQLKLSPSVLTTAIAQTVQQVDIISPFFAELPDD